MKLTVNGEPREFDGIHNVVDLLDALQKDAAHIAVAVNMDFVPKSAYGETEIKDNDEVEIVSPHPGG